MPVCLHVVEVALLSALTVLFLCLEVFHERERENIVNVGRQAGRREREGKENRDFFLLLSINNKYLEREVKRILLKVPSNADLDARNRRARFARRRSQPTD